MKKYLLLLPPLLLLLLLIVILLWPAGNDSALVEYWQEEEGLSKEEAEFLARSGPGRKNVPASQAALQEVSSSLSPEAAGNLLLESLGDATELPPDLEESDRESVEEILLLCEEKSCPQGPLPEGDALQSSTLIFLENATSVVLVGLRCLENPLRLDQPLLSEFYISEGRWAPRYLLRPLGDTPLQLSRWGKQDLRVMEEEFLSSCRSK